MLSGTSRERLEASGGGRREGRMGLMAPRTFQWAGTGIAGSVQAGMGRNSRLWVGLASAAMITTGLWVLSMTPQDSCLSLPCTEPQPISSKGHVTFLGEARSGSSSKPSLTPPAHMDPISFSPSSWGQVHQSPDDFRVLCCAEQGLSIQRGPLPLSARSVLHLGQLPGSGR